jgi:hypothetical protein
MRRINVSYHRRFNQRKIRSFMLQHDSYGSPDEDDVEPDVPVADVPGVHLDAFVIGVSLRPLVCHMPVTPGRTM